MEDLSADIAALRHEYTKDGLDESQVSEHPIKQFGRWFREALKCEVNEPNAMTLSTATKDGRPSGRIVLLKGFDDTGFTFYSNYKSRKGREMQDNPYASLNFFWPGMERQIRIEGRVEKVTPDESDRYFGSRPAGSRRGAIASPQSEIIENKEFLREQVRYLEEKYPDDGIPRPMHWGGYRLIPDMVEYWQGRPSRLHDRIEYLRTDDDNWKIQRLAP